jgi:peptidoglycan hydrolase-like protein with peptidoglycan-binding domain
MTRLLIVATLAVLLASCTSQREATPSPAATPPASTATPPRVVTAPTLPESDAITDRRAIAAAQRALNDLGYDLGDADGIFGPATRRMLIAFQKDHDVSQDGRLTPAIAALLAKLQSESARGDTLTIAAGDTLIYSDGAISSAAAPRELRWDQPDGAHSLVAVRPNTTAWPAAARAGLDWALTHALDLPAGAPPTQWSSTGVTLEYDIRSTVLSAREVQLVGDNAENCRRFEMRQRSPARRYPGLACKDARGNWMIPGTSIRLARPAAALGRQSAR